MDLVKGFNDYTGEEAEKRQKIKGILARTFRKYGFELAETPIIEYEEFVKGPENQAEDEAVSDIFKLKDKGNRALALRYEFTFQLKRTAKGRKLPYKRYQIGEVFRDEPVSSNRFRQITQCDVDIVGLSEIKAREEAEILTVTDNIFKQLKIPIKIFVGNRGLINEIIDELKISKNRKQVLREIDKLDKLPEKEVKEKLKKLKAEKILQLLKKPESYFKKYPAYNEIENLKKYCSYYGVKINFQPSLVRGLSYYNGNVFEIKTEKMKETICGGGSYEINDLQCTGISFGLDRLSQLAKVTLDEERILLISLGKDKEALKLAEKLREREKDITLYYGKPSKALDYANSRGIKEVIFIGNEEVRKGKYKARDMGSGKESMVKL